MYKINWQLAEKGIKLGLLKNQKFAVIAVTNLCGNQCKMCSIWKNEDKQHINLEKFKEVIKNLKEEGYGMVLLTGGDVLFHPQVFGLLDCLEESNLIYSFCTNAINVSNEMSTKLASYNNLFQILVSFDSSDPDIFSNIRGNKYILLKSLEGIHQLKEDGLEVVCILSILKYNLRSLEETVVFLSNNQLVLLSSNKNL